MNKKQQNTMVLYIVKLNNMKKIVLIHVIPASDTINDTEYKTNRHIPSAFFIYTVINIQEQNCHKIKASSI